MPNPGLRGHEGGSAQRQRWCGAQPVRQAAPRPILRALHQPLGERMTLDVPADTQEPIRSADHLHRETGRIYRRATQALPAPLPPGGMGSCYPFDEPRESRRTRSTHDEMPVIVHHAVGEQWKWMTFECLPHNLQEVPIILRSQKQWDRERSSMNDMKVAVGMGRPGRSQHGVGLSH